MLYFRYLYHCGLVWEAFFPKFFRFLYKRSGVFSSFWGLRLWFYHDFTSFFGAGAFACIAIVLGLTDVRYVKLGTFVIRYQIYGNSREGLQY